MNILIVDDNADTREMYAEYLSTRGFRVVQAANGRQALDVAAKQPPDAIVLDLTMPGLDGWEVIHRLRDGGASNTKILVVSGQTEEPAASGSRAYDAYLVKPCLPDDLERELHRVLGDRTIR